MSKTGHAFIKERMRLEDAVYGGEMSAHHYFRDFFYCDSGMIPWLLVAELICVKSQTLSDMVKDRIQKYPSSGEINFTVENAEAVFERIQAYDWGESYELSLIDGLDLIFDEWRMNVRSSNTEPLIRLNIESKGNERLVNEKVLEIEKIIQAVEKPERDASFKE
jgi:phosphomannomutase